MNHRHHDRANSLARLDTLCIAADLAPSTKSNLRFDFAGEFQPATGNGADADNQSGRNLHFGVREHAMCAMCVIASGLALSRHQAAGAILQLRGCWPPAARSRCASLPTRN